MIFSNLFQSDGSHESFSSFSFRIFQRNLSLSIRFSRPFSPLSSLLAAAGRQTVDTGMLLKAIGSLRFIIFHSNGKPNDKSHRTLLQCNDAIRLIVINLFGSLYLSLGNDSIFSVELFLRIIVFPDVLFQLFDDAIYTRAQLVE